MPAATMPGLTINNIGAESSRKRVRNVVAFDDDDDEIIDVQRASSSLRGDTRKRARHSSVELPPSKDGRRPSRASTPSSREHDDAAPQRGQGIIPDSPDSPPKTQYEIMRDNNFDHLKHQAADDQRATQRLRFRPNLLGDNAVADNGIIESITCVNFMCHTRLHCELGPLLNFIVGENGSGKSAILTAITLCLGGKASSTNRGGSLKSFVKEGRERAVLAVKIKNQGQDAYKPEIYGESIIVERHFGKNSSSGFRIKSALGQTISTKKQEVEEIVEYYALQVDNPLNVLSQDNARQFLNASTKTQKYKFFIEGVQLQQLDNDYRLISESLEQMVAKVPDQEERVKQAKLAMEKANRMKEAVDGNRKIRVRYRLLRHKIVWSQVIQEENELKRREEAIADIDAKIAETRAAVVEKEQQLEIAADKVERAKQALEDAQGEDGDLKRKVEEAEAVWQAFKTEVTQLHVDEREAHGRLKSATDSKKVLEKSIADEEKRLEDANGEAHSLKLNELEKAKEHIQQIEGEIESNKAREPELINQLDDSKKALATISDECQAKRNVVNIAQAKIKRLEENRGSLYDGYEAQVPNLLKMIASEKRFENKPIGPLGAHVQMSKPEWSSILETTLGKNLNAFLVTSTNDQKLLNSLIKRAGIKNCPVLIGSRNPINTDGKEPDADYDTILRVLKFDNLLVRDQLIINNMIEQVLLIPERTKAQDVMFGAPPRNVKACLSFHDRKRDEGLRLTNTNGNIATSPVQPNPNLRPRMKTDSGAQLEFLTREFHEREVEYRTIESERRRIQQQTQRIQAELEKLKKDRKTLETQLRYARVSLEKIEADLDQFDGVDGRLMVLREQLKLVEGDIQHHGMQYGTISGRKQKKNKEAEEAKKQLEAVRLNYRDFTAKLEKAEDRIKRHESLRQIAVEELNELHASVEIYEEDKLKAMAKRDRQVVHVKELFDQAMVICHKRVDPEPGETDAALSKEYQALGERLDSLEKQTGMKEEEVNNFVVETKKALDKVVSDLESIKEVNAGLRNTLNLRLDKWRKFQRYISSQSRANFIYLLSERGFRGKLLLDHERKALDLQVEPDKTEKKAAGRNTKTLSGGEKSFSSICLLLSIWEAMGSPLRCLDEFDVFMDNVNRAISTNMLITAARRSVNRQYIFITPNAIEGRNTLDKDVKIIRLTDPRQRTLTENH
ncbi:hypothetical protein B0T22DRAFT_536776 [Podospora appendiculata]|uniref:RecF/RecN/SMC N-terminal domain-containing protein n=1 Tax=Podospora appendiculata TaxID=314037 RepID=A0AAE0XCT9_9PEZI|nr:hypothetical protein B0T22DRAFT_536776 [Podospora appendiculata]